MTLKRFVCAAFIVALSIISATEAMAQVNIRIGPSRRHYHRRPVVRERVVVRQRPVVRERVIVRERPVRRHYYRRHYRY